MIYNYCQRESQIVLTFLRDSEHDFMKERVVYFHACASAFLHLLAWLEG